MNYTSITLGELLSSENETIKRNAVGILKALQNRQAIDKKMKVSLCYCNASGLSVPHYIDDCQKSQR